MKKSRLTESQIVVFIKEAESGITLTELLRSHCIGGAIFYNWSSKCDGLKASKLERMMELEQQLSDFKSWWRSSLEIT